MKNKITNELWSYDIAGREWKYHNETRKARYFFYRILLKTTLLIVMYIVGNKV